MADGPPTPKDSGMRARIMMVLVSAALVGSLLATAAQARGDEGRGGDDGFRDNHLSGGLREAPVDGYGSYGSRSIGSRGELRGYGGRDVWGHWGAYYGPMIPMI
jgi:hypothetical protein